jgi:hypothetical protein
MLKCATQPLLNSITAAGYQNKKELTVVSSFLFLCGFLLCCFF